MMPTGKVNLVLDSPLSDKNNPIKESVKNTTLK